MNNNKWSYKQLVTEYNNSDDATKRGIIKRSAKKKFTGNGYKESNFKNIKHEPFKTWSYLKYVKEYEKSKDGMSRVSVKRSAKKKFTGKEYRESDFVRKQYQSK